MNYEEMITDILCQAGTRGLSPRKIAKHVYNACNSFFEQQDFNKVYARVVYTLRKNSDKPHSLFVHPTHGRYRINTREYNFRRNQLLFK